jgi:hypothetical protein
MGPQEDMHGFLATAIFTPIALCFLWRAIAGEVKIRGDESRSWQYLYSFFWLIVVSLLVWNFEDHGWEFGRHGSVIGISISILLGIFIGWILWRRDKAEDQEHIDRSLQQ